MRVIIIEATVVLYGGEGKNQYNAVWLIAVLDSSFYTQTTSAPTERFSTDVAKTAVRMKFRSWYQRKLATELTNVCRDV